MNTFPFEASHKQILENPDRYVDAVFSCLESEFMIMPKGAGFVEYPEFERGYEVLKAATNSFSDLTPDLMLPAVLDQPVSLVVLRSMLGFTPPEWAYAATQRTGVTIPQGFVRTLDRKVRMSPNAPLAPQDETKRRLLALLNTACDLIKEGVPEVGPDQLHRLGKADTKLGLDSLKNAANLGIPYAMLLYERFLGRPFAGHRDSVSELVGDALESAVEEVLCQAGISFRKTRRAERIEGFDQAPDFIIPDEYNPKVIIEAKITEDDGTARDKVTRIQHLGELSMAPPLINTPHYEVVACIGGRGFGVRREDMKKLILATRGKVFTLKTLNHLVEHTRLKEFRAKQ